MATASTASAPGLRAFPTRFLARDPLAIGALAVIVGLVVCSVASAWVAPADPLAIHLDSLLSGPSRTHLLGTDQIGRDILSRLIYGTRWSLGAALVVTVLVTATGVLIGVLSGYLGGVVDTLTMRVVDALLAFPTLLLALAVVAVTGPGLEGVVVALASIGWAGYARVVRGLVTSLREREFITSARALGASDGRVVIRHLLPHLVSPVVVLATLEVGQLILAVAGLSFLGLGVQTPTPEWGVMLNEGRIFLFRAPQLMIYPGIAITVTVFAFNLLGDRLRDILDPRFGETD